MGSLFSTSVIPAQAGAKLGLSARASPNGLDPSLRWNDDVWLLASPPTRRPARR